MNSTSEVNPQPGMRVGVFFACEEANLMLLGYGIYEGDEVPPEDILAPEVGVPNLLQMPVPKLVLDDGTVIWGCEAWWETEIFVQNLAAGRQIVKLKIDSLRAIARSAWDKANKGLDADEEALR